MVPTLRQVYLDNSAFYCHCNANDVENETDEEDDEELEMEENDENVLIDINEDEEVEDEDDEEDGNENVLVRQNVAESFQLPSRRPTHCTCKYQLMAALASFVDLPKPVISYGNSMQALQ